MSVYLTKKDVNFGGTIVPAGAKVDLASYEEEFVARLVEKGSVVEVTEGDEEATPVAPVTPPADPVTPPADETPVPPTVTSGTPSAEQIEQDLKDLGA